MDNHLPFDGVLPNVEYYWRRTDGWNWFGTQRWWEIFVVFANGFHGGGGACVEERWRWNDSQQTIWREYRNLSHDETVEMIAAINYNQSLSPATRV